MDKVAQGREQIISNKNGFDVLYPNREAWFADKTFNVIDVNFKKTEDYLIKELKKTIDSTMSYNKNLSRVEDMKKPNLKNLDLQRNVPLIQPDSIDINMKLGDIALNDPNVKVYSSRPNKILI
jgi:hypothetical protein